MIINLELVDDAFHMVATNASGQTVSLDSGPPEKKKGMSPMELVAVGLAGCSSIDVLSILRKGRHELDQFQVRVDAERRSEPLPRVFETIHLHFEVEGEVTAKALRRAINLSLGSYCSVSRMIEKTAAIRYSFALNGKKYAPEPQAG